MSKPDIYTPNIDALKLLRSDSTTAWITSDGILHVVPLFGHLELFIDQQDLLPEVASYLRTFVTDEDGLKVSKHHMAAAMDMIYAYGWGRVGTFGGDKLELDCAREHLTELRRKAKAVARVLNRALVCHVVHPTQQKSKKAPAALSRDAFWSSLIPGFKGWLSPDGRLFETSPEAPFSTFIDDPDRLPEMAYALAQAVSSDESRQRDEFCEALEGVDHMPWHQFWEAPYNPDEDEAREMTASILAHGWGRLSVSEPHRIILETSPAHAGSLGIAMESLVAKAEYDVEIRDFAELAFPYRSEM